MRVTDYDYIVNCLRSFHVEASEVEFAIQPKCPKCSVAYKDMGQCVGSNLLLKTHTRRGGRAAGRANLSNSLFLVRHTSTLLGYWRHPSTAIKP
jgi:hypothetical protein